MFNLVFRVLLCFIIYFNDFCKQNEANNQFLPANNQYLPAENQYLPANNQYLLAENDYLPAKTLSRRANIDYLLAKTQYLLAENDYLLAKTQYLPANIEFSPFLLSKMTNNIASGEKKTPPEYHRTALKTMLRDNKVAARALTSIELLDLAFHFQDFFLLHYSNRWRVLRNNFDIIISAKNQVVRKFAFAILVVATFV
ncbi:hypothetical protein BH10ACI1_BH10ACI1_02970 [soil metagenome]